MYQLPKCPYSYFLEALEFYLTMFFPVSILKIHKKTLVRESLFNTVPGLNHTTSLKKKLHHECSPVSLEKFFQNSTFAEHLRMTASA